MTFSILPLLVSIYFISVGAIVLSRNFCNSLARIFFLVCFTTSIWQFFFSVGFNVWDSDLAFLIFKMSWCAILFLPTTLYHFLVVLSEKRSDLRFVYASYLLCVVWLLFLIFSPYLISGVHSFSWGYYPKAGALEIFHVIQTMFVVLRGLYLVYKKHKIVEDCKFKLQLQYCMLAIFIYLFAAVDYMVNYGFEMLSFPPGVFFIVVSLTIICFAIIKHDLIQIGLLLSLIVSRLAIYSLFLILFIIGHFVFKKTYLPNDNLLFVKMSFLVVLFCESYNFLIMKVRNISDSVLVNLKQKNNIQKSLSSKLDNVVVIDDLVSALKVFVTENLKLDLAALFIRKDLALCSEEIGDSYVNILNNSDIKLNTDFVGFLVKSRSVIFDDYFSKYLNDFGNAKILIPFVNSNNLAGFMLLSGKPSLKFWHYDLFESLIIEIGLVFEKIRLYQEVLKEKKISIEKEERAKIYKSLAGSIAHEVRNPLNTINMLKSEISSVLDDFEEDLVNSTRGDNDFKKE